MMSSFGKKATVGFLVAMVCGALTVGALAGCSGGGSSSATASSASASSASTSASASASASGASASASVSATASGASASASASATASSASAPADSTAASSAASGLTEIDGVIVKGVGVEMVGDTPNLMATFSNPTDKDVEVDCGKFEVKKEDGTVVDFGKTKKTVNANQPYVQWAFTAKAGTLEKGEKVTVSYDGKDLGTFEVTEF